MAFQAPKIIGGGSLIAPQAQGDPFASVTDTINTARDRRDEQARDKQTAMSRYMDEYDLLDEEGNILGPEAYMQNLGYGQSSGNGGGLLGMVGKGVSGAGGFLKRGAESIFNRGDGQQQASGLPFDPDDPESIMKYQADNGLKVDGIAGDNTMAKVSQNQTPDEPMVLNPDYQEEEQWEGRPSPMLSPLERIRNRIGGIGKGIGKGVGDFFKEAKRVGRGGGSGQGPLQTTPESNYQKQLHAGTAQDPYGHGTKKDTSGATKENLFTKAADLITRPSKRKYENATEEGREIVKNLDLSDNDAVAEFQKIVGLEPDGIAGKDTIKLIRALQSGEHEKSTSGYNSRMQIMGQQEGGYALVGGGDLPGKRTGDKNPAMLEDGEYVLNRNAVKAIGKGYLDYINDERYPRFQRGGFQGEEVVGGRAEIVDPSVGATTTDSGGGSEIDPAMLMSLAGMQRGGQIPGYQFGGGFLAPGVTGSGGQIIRPEAMDNSGAFDFGGGGENFDEVPQSEPSVPSFDQQREAMASDEEVILDDGFSYQQGGTVRRPTGYQTGGWSGVKGARKYPAKEAQTRLDEDARRVTSEGQIERMARDVTKRGKEESALSKEKEAFFNTFIGSGLKKGASALDWAFNPMGVYSPLASAMSGTDAESFQDLPEALWSKYSALPEMTAEDYPGMGIIDEPGYGRVAGAYTDAYGISPPNYAKQMSEEEILRKLKGGNSGGFFFNR